MIPRFSCGAEGSGPDTGASSGRSEGAGFGGGAGGGAGGSSGGDGQGQSGQVTKHMGAFPPLSESRPRYVGRINAPSTLLRVANPPVSAAKTP
jgi:hypothetical protein